MTSEYKTILITGATGFVGSHLVRYYTHKPFKIIALGRSKPNAKLLKTAVEYYQTDIRSDNLPSEVDIIIHSAGLASDTATWKELQDNNVFGTKNLINKVKHKLFIYISSASVYPISDKIHRETDNIHVDLLNDYGRSKYLAEEIVMKHNHSVVLRPRAIYGTHDRVLLPKILRMKKVNKIIAPCDISKTISMTNIDNLIYAIELCIANPEIAINQVFNVTDSITYILKDIITNLFYGIYNQKIPIQTLPFPVSKSISKIAELLHLKTKLTKTALDMICFNNVLSNDKIETLLKYNPKIDFNSYLPELINWIASKRIDKIINDPSGIPWE